MDADPETLHDLAATLHDALGDFRAAKFAEKFDAAESLVEMMVTAIALLLAMQAETSGQGRN